MPVSGSISNQLEAKQNLSAFKALFIADPGHAETDAIAIKRNVHFRRPKTRSGIMSRKLTTIDRIIEIFNTPEHHQATESPSRSRLIISPNLVYWFSLFVLFVTKTLKIQAGNLSTNHRRRDEHANSADFL